MASGILGIALTGLNAAQAGIRVTEHNISNVNTLGYRRQEADFAALPPQYTGAGYFGTGAGVETVRSLYSQFLDNELLLDQAQMARYESYTAGATQLDKMLGDSGSGLSTAIDSFFGALNELANDPTSGAARQIVLSAGTNLAGRVNTLDAQLRTSIASTNSELASLTSQVNLYAGQIAKLNDDIARAEAAAVGQPANDLRDQRQQLITDLNKLVNVSTVQQGDGSVNVFIGSGQPLVVGNNAYTMSTALDPNNSMLRVPTLDVGGTVLTLNSSLITGGRMGGLLDYREEVLLPAFDDLNNLAVTIGTEVNTLHQSGLDYNLNAGGNFFTDPASVPSGDYARQMKMVLTDTSQVAAAAIGADGPGDNTNALALADLRFKAVIGTSTFSEAYGQTISRTAARASEADLNLSAYRTLTASAEAASRSVSGVNLDEEAMNLVRFQQAYQASAKAMKVASDLFNEVLGILR